MQNNMQIVISTIQISNLFYFLVLKGVLIS